jgi:hypothetical protein
MTDERYPIPKSEWGEGPWQSEPDRVEWRSPHGYPLLMVRGPHGNWCGYVGLPPGHPWHGKGTGDVDADVHGGLTYADACQGEVCHMPAPGEPDGVWWLGFDCAHAFDVMPAMTALLKTIGHGHDLGGTYRDLDYVKAECESLAAQACDASKSGP